MQGGWGLTEVGDGGQPKWQDACNGGGCPLQSRGGGLNTHNTHMAGCHEVGRMPNAVSRTHARLVGLT